MKKLILLFLVPVLLASFVLNSSANNPYLDAQCAINKRKYEEAFNILMPLSKKEDIPAMSMLATLHLQSRQVNPYFDTEKAYYWGKKAAESGDPVAEFSFANIINTLADDKYTKSYNKTIEKVKLAIVWYRRAANQGHAYAQIKMADYNLMGAYIELNPERAYMWYELAARRYVPIQDQGYNGVNVAFRELKHMNEDKDFTKENRKNALHMVDEWEKAHPNAAKKWRFFDSRPGELPFEEMKKRDCFLKVE